MSFTLISVIEAFVLAASISIDAFTVGFTHGSNKIKIPLLSVLLITIVSSLAIGIAFLAGYFFSVYIDESITVVICFTILLIIGIMKLLDSVTKSIIRKYNNLNKELKFSILNFKFILNLYANPEDADIDCSKIISIREAISIAIIVSLDGIAVGFAAGLPASANGLLLFIFSLITNSVAVLLGCRLGNTLANKLPFNLSWIGGTILIALAILKLF